MRKLLIIISLGLCSVCGFSQQEVKDVSGQSCTESLKAAENYYMNGLYEDCLKTLDLLLNTCELSRNDKLMVLELQAKSFLEINDRVKAESAVYKLMKKFPHYELREDENPEMFNRLIRRYQVHPLFTIGIKNTANFLRHKTLKPYYILPDVDYSKSLDESGYWFTYYGTAEFEFIKDLSLSVDGMIFVTRYFRQITHVPSFRLSFSAEDYCIEFPFYLKKYVHPGKNFLIYASGGFGPFLIYKSTGSVTVSYKKEDEIPGKNIDIDSTLSNIHLLPLRNTLTGQWNVGVGVGYTIKNLRFFLDARYLSLSGSFTAPEKSENIPELKNDFFYIDQSMKINQFELGATISYTLFNSIKRIRK